MEKVADRSQAIRALQRSVATINETLDWLESLHPTRSRTTRIEALRQSSREHFAVIAYLQSIYASDR